MRPHRRALGGSFALPRGYASALVGWTGMHRHLFGCRVFLWWFRHCFLTTLDLTCSDVHEKPLVPTGVQLKR